MESLQLLTTVIEGRHLYPLAPSPDNCQSAVRRRPHLSTTIDHYAIHRRACAQLCVLNPSRAVGHPAAAVLL